MGFSYNMSEDLIECSCCGKLVPAANIELAYRRPDVIASLSSEELEARSTHTDDICILDGERFFVRCTISLPIRMSSESYAIGAWAEISERDFATVQKLWDEVDQANAPAIDGVLANQIALTTGSSGCRVLVTLTGPTTRPCIAIKDQACSMYLEQKEGLPAHRASEYANVCRKRASVKVNLVVVAEQELPSSACPCCDQTIRTYCGHITAGEDGEVCADYWLRIPEGHGGFFTVAVSIDEGGNPRVAVLVGEATHDGLTYRLLDRENSPWQDFGEYGMVMDRMDVLDDPGKPVFFSMVDAIAALDLRLIAHTRPHLNTG